MATLPQQKYRSILLQNNALRNCNALNRTKTHHKPASFKNVNDRPTKLKVLTILPLEGGWKKSWGLRMAFT